jgi:RHS repeat-associated protein
MGCEALPIEYYESLDSEKRLFGAKPLHKKTPIGDFSNIAILCLRYYNPLNGKWLSRDPINELGSITLRGFVGYKLYFETLYGFVGNNAIDWFDVLGLECATQTFTNVTTHKYTITKVKVSTGKSGTTQRISVKDSVENCVDTTTYTIVVDCCGNATTTSDTKTKCTPAPNNGNAASESGGTKIIIGVSAN